MSNGEQYHILIVDDEKANLDILQHVLKPHCSVYIAKSGEAALKIAQDSLPDLILLDIIMPGIDGFEVLARLKENDATRDIPVIFVTGMTDPASEEKGIRLGAVDYIPKPFHPVIVWARVQTQLKMLDRLRELQQIDAAFGFVPHLPNRPHFERVFLTEWRRALRTKSSLATLIVSVPIQGNDTAQSVLDTLRKSVRRSADLVVRLDEKRFGILLPSTEDRGATTIADEIRTRLHNSHPDLKPVDVETMSFSPDLEQDPDSFLANLG